MMATQTETQTRKELMNTRVGVVSSDKRNKSCTVVVAYQSRHPKYGKYIRHTSKFHVDDPKNLAKVGDRVQIANCRPISKTKSWRLVRVIEEAPKDI